MKESYVELLVERKSSPVMKFLQILTGVLAVVCFMLGWVGMAPVLLLPGIALGVVAYLIYMRANIEYEYLYVDKELTIDIIRAKSKRKTVETYDISNMELFAPANSPRLAEYDNRKPEVKDYSSKKPDGQPYAMIYNRNNQCCKVILEGSEELKNCLYNVSPRKVFTD